jgi:uncharacterized membrane protein YoaK (UPF0700 family)
MITETNSRSPTAAPAAQPAAPVQRRVANVTSSSLRLGVLLASVGGFLDAYTWFSRHHVFANSQTGNVVLLGMTIAHRGWREALHHLWPILAFIAGVFFAETLRSPVVSAIVRRPARASIAMEILVLTVVGALPESVPDLVVTVLVSFTSSVQVSTFRTLVKWPYNSTMTTGNLRTATQALYQVMIDRSPDALLQAKDFGLVISAFLTGAIAGALVTGWIGVHAAWVAVLMLCIAPALFILDERT